MLKWDGVMLGYPVVFQNETNEIYHSPNFWLKLNNIKKALDSDVLNFLQQLESNKSNTFYKDKELHRTNKNHFITNTFLHKSCLQDNINDSRF